MRVKDIFRLAISKGYGVTEDGVAYGPRGVTGRVQFIGDLGYVSFHFCDGGQTFTVYVGRFQAYLKYGLEALKKGTRIGYVDGDRLNNSLDNIRVCEKGDKAFFRHGKRLLGDEEIRQMRELYAQGSTLAELHRQFLVSTVVVQAVIQRRTYQDVR